MALLIVRIREYIREFVLSVRNVWLTKFLKNNIEKGAKISWGATLDKSHPKGVFIRKGAYLTSGSIVLAHDGSRGKKLNTYIEQNAFISVNAIILPGVTIGKESIVGAGAVVSSSVPPYAIVMGNPAKVIGFKMKPDEIVEYEKKIYSEDERMKLETLEKNYKKYYIDRIKIIIESQK